MQIGDILKPFKAIDQDGNEFDMTQLIGQKPLVIYFYPKNFTPGCTKEACDFRDNNQDFVDLGAEVIGISADSEKSHHRFATKYKLPFTLITDANGTIRRQFGVKKSLLGLLPGRETFVFDKHGVLVHRHNSMDARSHIRKALKEVKALRES